MIVASSPNANPTLPSYILTSGAPDPATIRGQQQQQQSSTSAWQTTPPLPHPDSRHNPSYPPHPLSVHFSRTGTMQADHHQSIGEYKPLPLPRTNSLPSVVAASASATAATPSPHGDSNSSPSQSQSQSQSMIMATEMDPYGGGARFEPSMYSMPRSMMGTTSGGGIGGAQTAADARVRYSSPPSSQSHQQRSSKPTTTAPQAYLRAFEHQPQRLHEGWATPWDPPPPPQQQQQQQQHPLWTSIGRPNGVQQSPERVMMNNTNSSGGSFFSPQPGTIIDNDGIRDARGRLLARSPYITASNSFASVSYDSTR